MTFQLLPASPPILALCAFLSYVIFRYTRKPNAPYPPGPPPKPLVGNAFDIPSNKLWLRLIQWSEEYNSDIIHLSALNTHIVALRRIEDIVELMERRSANYSSRPPNPIFKLLGMENLLVMLPYGDTLKKQRRILDSGLKRDAIPIYHHVQIERVHLFLEQLLLHPGMFKAHCKWLGASITMAVALGYDFIPGQKSDRYVDSVDFTIDVLNALLLPGKTLVAVFPFLTFIPPWLPGASTQRLGAQVRSVGTLFKKESLENAKRNMDNGTSKDCMLNRILESHKRSDGSFEDEEDIMDAIYTMYLGGVETGQIVQLVFIMAMALHPAEQKKAQDELDRVIGSDRLPTFADRASMPYVEALLREVLRWRPAVPLGFGHSTLKDDVYKGYYIPKGTIVMPNVWAITRNKDVYPDPEAFKPERFLKPDGTLNDDNIGYLFGFGRRICPGRHMADKILWLMMASVLATFNISKAKTEDGSDIHIDPHAFADGLSVNPLPFKCSIVSRYPQAESLIRSAAELAWQSIRSE